MVSKYQTILTLEILVLSYTKLLEVTKRIYEAGTSYFRIYRKQGNSDKLGTRIMVFTTGTICLACCLREESSLSSVLGLWWTNYRVKSSNSVWFAKVTLQAHSWARSGVGRNLAYSCFNGSGHHTPYVITTKRSGNSPKGNKGTFRKEKWDWKTKLTKACCSTLLIVWFFISDIVV